MHFDHFIPPSGHVLAHVVRPDRQLAVATIDQADELNDARAPEVDERVERRADRAPGIQDIVDQDDCPVGDVHRDGGGPQGTRRALVNVVTIQGDVQLAKRHFPPFELPYPLLEASGERYATRAETNEDQIINAAVSLHYLVGDPRDGAPKVV